METGPAILVSLSVAVIVGLAAMVTAVRVVPQNQVHLLERLGRYRRTLQPGLNFAVPIVDRVGARVDLREQRIRIGPTAIATSSGSPVHVVAEIDYSVTDAVRAVYEIADYRAGVETVAVSTLRNLIDATDPDEVRARWHTFNQQFRGILDTSGARWGLTIARAEVLSITRGDARNG